ncbi:hypothetical protein C5B85_01375 [Pseudoclavibacter sp. AY1F1]|nr:hypothetical protein C5B85_01375 [Pseudoclavibacter sp. AY1F1]
MHNFTTSSSNETLVELPRKLLRKWRLAPREQFRFELPRAYWSNHDGQRAKFSQTIFQAYSLRGEQHLARVTREWLGWRWLDGYLPTSLPSIGLWRQACNFDSAEEAEMTSGR